MEQVRLLPTCSRVTSPVAAANVGGPPNPSSVVDQAGRVRSPDPTREGRTVQMVHSTVWG